LHAEEHADPGRGKSKLLPSEQWYERRDGAVQEALRRLRQADGDDAYIRYHVPDAVCRMQPRRGAIRILGGPVPPTEEKEERNET
jgi:hypothetical protein